MRDRTYRRDKERKRKSDCIALYHDIFKSGISSGEIIKLTSTHKKCSCSICGNFRRNRKGKDKLKIQERRQDYNLTQAYI